MTSLRTDGEIGILALIPARGGSKSIPRKNIYPVAGKPLIAHSILQATESKYITRVIVSTDDKEIADVSRKWGAEVPFIRPAEFSQDQSLDIEVFDHALRWLKENDKYQPDLIVHLRPTGPVRRVALIDQAIEAIQAQPEADALRSVQIAKQNPYKMWFIENGLLKPILQLEGIAEPYNMPRQKLPKTYWQNGTLDITRPKTVLEKKSMMGEKILAFEINAPAYDLDYPEDIPEIETALEKLKRGEHLNESDLQGERFPS
jgi:CMP-N,N'-diacetyllegionaminic acid synthase